MGEITLGEKVYVGDPAIKIEDKKRYVEIDDVLPGTYNCILNRTGVPQENGRMEFSSDSLEVRHINYDDFTVKKKEKLSVYIYSTMAGIFDFDVVKQFIEIAQNKGGKLLRDNNYNVWYNRAVECINKSMKNPDYVSFEHSKFWSDDFLELQQEEYSQDVYMKYLNAKTQYDALGLKEEIWDMEAGGVLDKTGALFGNIYMTDEDILITIEKNEDGQIIAFKINSSGFEAPVFNFSK